MTLKLISYDIYLRLIIVYARKLFEFKSDAEIILNMLKFRLIFSFFLAIFSLAGAQVEVQSHIESVEIMVADCDHCGMSTLGHIHVKVKLDISIECCTLIII